MDENIIFVKIESLERCVERISTKTPAKRQDLFDDLDRQDIIVF